MVDTTLDNFLSVFGNDPEAVKNEIRAFWQQQGHLTDPTELYNHLIDVRVGAHRIDPTRGETLKKLFSESFSPEHTTGYDPKHRLPIRQALADLYGHDFPEKPLYVVEGDVGNLGGVNDATRRSAEQLQHDNPEAFRALVSEYGLGQSSPQEQINRLGRIKADETIATITGITRRELEGVANVQAIRKGGDEILLIVEPKPGNNLETIKARLAKIQTDVDAFSKDAGLDNIPHLKYKGDPAKGGVGIGLGVEDMHGIDQSLQGHALDLQILEAKEARAAARIDVTVNSDPPDMLRLNGALAASETSRQIADGENYRVIPGHIEPGANPEEARLTQMRQAVQTSGQTTSLSNSELSAVNGTHAITAKTDTVTGMPLFGNMQGEQLPHFMNRVAPGHGGAKLVHIDFSNMAGGNTLGTAVGDAMGTQFAQAVRDGLSDVGMGKLEPYAAAKPGGKFALIVPADTSPEQVQELQTAIQKRVTEAATRPLPLLPQAREMLPPGTTDIRMADIINPKSGLKGVDVSIAISDKPINPSLSIGPPMSELERRTELQYQATTNRRQSEENSHVNRTTPAQSGDPHQPVTAGRETPGAGEIPADPAAAGRSPRVTTPAEPPPQTGGMNRTGISPEAPHVPSEHPSGDHGGGAVVALAMAGITAGTVLMQTGSARAAVTQGGEALASAIPGVGGTIAGLEGNANEARVRHEVDGIGLAATTYLAVAGGLGGSIVPGAGTAAGIGTGATLGLGIGVASDETIRLWERYGLGHKDVTASLGETTVVAGAQAVGGAINAIGNALTPGRVELSDDDKRFFKLIDALPSAPSESTPKLNRAIELNADRKTLEASLTTTINDSPALRQQLASVEAELSAQIDKLAPTSADQDRLIAQLAAPSINGGNNKMASIIPEPLRARISSQLSDPYNPEDSRTVASAGGAPQRSNTRSLNG